MFRFILSLVAVCLVATSVDARPRFRGTTTTTQTAQSSRTVTTADGVTTTAAFSSATTTTTSETPDALAEVNAVRAQRGLRPFVRDELLTQGALAAARQRAAGRIAGHLPNDFGMLPPGGLASAAGCAVRSPGDGFAACCVYEDFRFAGAASAIGPDGRVYHHLFVRR